MNKKPQIVFIHGGMTFKSKKEFQNFLSTVSISFDKNEKWSGEYFENKLNKKAEVLKPKMPLKENARYEDWKIYFENVLTTIGDTIILVGNSLGGIFLAKYLSENSISKTILSVYLIAPPFDDTIEGEDLTNGFVLKNNLSKLDAYKPKLFFSNNDEIVPIEHAKKYRKYLENADIITYNNKNGHFQMKQFPELISMIKRDCNNFKKKYKYI